MGIALLDMDVSAAYEATSEFDLEVCTAGYTGKLSGVTAIGAASMLATGSQYIRKKVDVVSSIPIAEETVVASPIVEPAAEHQE